MGSSRASRPSAGGRVGPSDDQSKGPHSEPLCGEAAGISHYLPRFFVSSPQATPEPLSPPDPSAGAVGHEFLLDADDGHHALKVLRLRSGDQCEVVVVPDPPGSEPGEVPGGVAYLATVTQATDEVRVMLVAPLEGRWAGANFNTAVGIVQALTRPAAMDYLVEKGTEVGASFFLILPSVGSPSRTETKQGARLARWRRIAQEAAKQSKQLRIPSVEVTDSVAEGLVRLGADTRSLVLEPGAVDELFGTLSSVSGWRVPGRGTRTAQRPRRLALWVGPEGGWTEDELALLGPAGAETVRLGQSVLRAETAGPVAVAVARLALGDW